MSLIAETLYFVIPFVLVISIVIVIHELGHYWAGRYFGAAVESFSVGFGNSIFETRDKNNTRWRLNWLPLGGFVSFVNEGGVIENEGHPKEHASELSQLDESEMPVGRAFTELSPGARIIVALAGPFANFITAIIVFAFIAVFLGNPIQKISIAGIEEGSAAEEAGLQVDDIFLQVNGRNADQMSVILEEIKMSSNDEVDLLMQRDGAEVLVPVTPRRVTRTNGLNIKERTGMIGVQLQPVTVDQNKLNPVEAVGFGVSETFSTIGSSLEMMGRIIVGKESLQQLSGPVGIASVTGNITKATMQQDDVSLGRRIYALTVTMVQFIAFISVAIGFFNLLPLPILDGGLVVFNTYEALTGKGLSEELLLKTKFATLLVLAALAIFITLGDFEEAGLLELFRGL
ncbi:MAG: peptidase M50 [Ponticaulis sp.]|nr:peptidase M50 [Ponticaulis sp.]|tara:strand:- start:52090 stop:53292 length:1203 start_codon:yes stop_codon:yes gene_type:complete